MEDDTSKSPAVFPALGSAGPLQITAESSPPAGRAPVQQDAVVEGRWLLVTTGPTPLVKITLVLFQVMGMGAAGPGRGLNGLPLSFRRSLATEGGADLLAAPSLC